MNLSRPVQALECKLLPLRSRRKTAEHASSKSKHVALQLSSPSKTSMFLDTDLLPGPAMQLNCLRLVH